MIRLVLWILASLTLSDCLEPRLQKATHIDLVYTLLEKDKCELKCPFGCKLFGVKRAYKQLCWYKMFSKNFRQNRPKSR